MLFFFIIIYKGGIGPQVSGECTGSLLYFCVYLVEKLSAVQGGCAEESIGNRGVGWFYWREGAVCWIDLSVVFALNG